MESLPPPSSAAKIKVRFSDSEEWYADYCFLPPNRQKMPWLRMFASKVMRITRITASGYSPGGRLRICNLKSARRWTRLCKKHITLASKISTRWVQTTARMLISSLQNQTVVGFLSWPAPTKEIQERGGRNCFPRQFGVLLNVPRLCPPYRTNPTMTSHFPTSKTQRDMLEVGCLAVLVSMGGDNSRWVRSLSRSR
jgi:hypothetical protein